MRKFLIVLMCLAVSIVPAFCADAEVETDEVLEVIEDLEQPVVCATQEEAEALVGFKLDFDTSAVAPEMVEESVISVDGDIIECRYVLNNGVELVYRMGKGNRDVSAVVGTYSDIYEYTFNKGEEALVAIVKSNDGIIENICCTYNGFSYSLFMNPGISYDVFENIMYM